MRTDAALYVVLDTSRSMSAAPGRSAPTRFARARRFALAFRDRLPDIPAGVASFTDRVLPHLLPTSDRASFASTLYGAIGIGRPPPGATAPVATSYGELDGLARSGAFAPAAKRRLLVLLTDGESRAYRPAAILAALRRTRTALFVVRFWSRSDRVYVHGRDAGYRPAPGSTAPLDELGALSAGGQVFGPGDAALAAAAARGYFGSGASVTVGSVRRSDPLGPWVALAALVPFAGVVGRRGGGRRASSTLARTWRALPAAISTRSR